MSDERISQAEHYKRGCRGTPLQTHLQVQTTKCPLSINEKLKKIIGPKIGSKNRQRILNIALNIQILLPSVDIYIYIST